MPQFYVPSKPFVGEDTAVVMLIAVMGTRASTSSCRGLDRTGFQSEVPL